MGKAGFNEDFKRNATAEICERGYRVANVSLRRSVNRHSPHVWER
jgi:transposase-like protein